MHLGHQFECNMFMDSKLDSKLNSGIPNWFGSLPCCAHLLDSPALPWCSVCPHHHLYGS
jgi:hypothetical protein